MKRVSKSKQKSYDTNYVAPSNRHIHWSYDLSDGIGQLVFYIRDEVLWKQERVFGYPTKFELAKGCEPEFNGPEKLFADKFQMIDFDAEPKKTRRKSMSKSIDQAFYERWGVTRSAAMKIIRAVVIKTQYEPIREYDSIWKPGRVFNGNMERKGCTRSQYADMVLKATPILEQMKADGQGNIMPLAVLRQSNASELRNLFGKNPWKRISKLTRTHNKMIAELTIDEGIELSSRNYSYALVHKRVSKNFDRHMGLKPLAIAYTDTLIKEQGSAAAALRVDIRDIYRTAMYINDMYIAGVQINPQWSTRRIKEEHDKWMIEERDRLAAIKRKEEIEYQGEFATNTPRMFGDIKATILNTVESIEIEGKVMGHCVGTYSRRAFKGEYRVVRIERNGYTCTLGLIDRHRHDYPHDFVGPLQKCFTFQQMYGKFNATVEDEVILAAKEDIIKWVSEEYMEYNK